MLKPKKRFLDRAFYSFSEGVFYQWKKFFKIRGVAYSGLHNNEDIINKKDFFDCNEETIKKSLDKIRKTPALSDKVDDKKLAIREFLGQNLKTENIKNIFPNTKYIKCFDYLYLGI